MELEFNTGSKFFTLYLIKEICLLILYIDFTILLKFTMY